MLKNFAIKISRGRSTIIAIAVLVPLIGGLLAACSKSPGEPPNIVLRTKGFGFSAHALDSAVILNWPRINDAKKYNLYWSLTPGVTKWNGTKIADVTAPFEHTGLSNGTPVYYIYTVETSAGEGAASQEITLVPGINAANSPEYVEATGRSERVELFWCCVANATSYNIYGKTSHGDAFGDPILKDATSPAVITLLQNNQSYYFAVTAVVNGVESPVSNETVASTYAPEVFTLTAGEVPEKPRHVYAFAGHQQVTIGAGEQKDALRYTIYWNTTGGVTEASEHISNVALPYTLLELEDNKKYYYRIAAQNQHGSSALSSEISNTPNNDTINDLVAGIVDVKLGDCIKKYAMETGWSYQRELDSLECNNEKVLDLAGLEKFSNLSYVNLNQLDNVVSIITGLDSLAQLANLNQLRLSGDSISDLSFLSGLMNLAYLDLTNNHITDAHLATLKELAGQNLFDLNTLGLSNNPIISLATLAPLVNLEYLYVQNSRINDLSPLAGLVRLKELWIAHDLQDDQANRITTLEPLRNLTALTDLRFENNAINGIGLNPLAGHTNLQVLKFDNNLVDVLTALQDLKQLRILSAGGNQITSAHLGDISGLTNLEELHLNGNLIEDVSPLANLTALSFLDLSNNRIGANNHPGWVNRLDALTHVTYLGLGGNGTTLSCTELDLLFAHLGSPSPVDLDGNPATEETFSPPPNSYCI